MAGVEAYLVSVRSHATAAGPTGFPIQDTFWWVDGEEFIGRIAVRHWLTDGLLDMGGHIGYEVRPSWRRRGHATAMLVSALEYAAGIGLDRVLLTCAVDNLASQKVIERCGGILEDERAGRLRFWIWLST
jgi:predicted acetyltransferase